MSARHQSYSYARRLILDPLETRIMLTVAGSQIMNLQAVGDGLEAVSVEVATPKTTSVAGVPVATGMTSIRYDQGCADYRVSLAEAFEDSDGLIKDLVFSVAEAGDSIFDSLLIDTTTGELVVDLLSGATGSAMLTVTAKDADGHLATTEIDLDVEQLGGAPGLESFTMTLDEHQNRVFSGNVSLNDSHPNDLEIEFGGDLNGHTTTVASDGTFSFTALASDYVDSQRIVTATVETASGETSNILLVEWD